MWRKRYSIAVPQRTLIHSNKIFTFLWYWLTLLLTVEKLGLTTNACDNSSGAIFILEFATVTFVDKHLWLSPKIVTTLCTNKAF